jgi:hypothetical protein
LPGTHAAITEHPPITDEQIAQRAYELWEARGCPSGDGTEDWEAARAELMAQRVAVIAGNAPELVRNGSHAAGQHAAGQHAAGQHAAGQHSAAQHGDKPTRRAELAEPCHALAGAAPPSYAAPRGRGILLRLLDRLI